MIAPPSLDTNAAGLQQTRKQVSADHRAHNATDDRAADAVARHARADANRSAAALAPFGRVEGSLPSLTDADLPRETTQLRALQQRQIRASGALPLADQVPQTLLTLCQ